MEVKIRENGTERWADVEALTVYTIPLSVYTQKINDQQVDIADLKDLMTKRENRLLKAWEKMR